VEVPASRDEQDPVSQAAKQLGVGENTLRRVEARGWVTPSWRPWGERQPMRVFAEADIPMLRAGWATGIGVKGT